MSPSRRLVAIGLIALLALAGCTASAGTDRTRPTGIGNATTAAGPGGTPGPAASSTLVPTDPTTTTSSPDPASSTAVDASAGPGHCPGGAEVLCEANTAAGSAYLRANVVGGTYGFRFVRVGGGVVASLNPDRVFYPASSVKVLAHLHAVRWAAAQPDPADALAVPIPVYEDPCAGGGAFRTEPRSAVLAAMMIDSDNQRADAVLDYFGTEAVNASAREVVGTSNTVLAHRFGCGGPGNDPANQSTAFDLSRVYEQVARGEVLDAEAARIFARLMLGLPWPSLELAVAAEGEALGLDSEAVEGFQEGIALLYKAGWWGTNLSIGGLLGLPAVPCAGASPREYAFAVFVDGAEAVADGFEVSDVVAVVLREEIRAALREWAAPSCPP
jgi:hypothetical protein